MFLSLTCRHTDPARPKEPAVIALEVGPRDSCRPQPEVIKAI